MSIEILIKLQFDEKFQFLFFQTIVGSTHYLEMEKNIVEQIRVSQVKQNKIKRLSE